MGAYRTIYFLKDETTSPIHVRIPIMNERKNDIRLFYERGGTS